ncbi:hypothetical protein Q5Y75_09025 [Ruegeria sp. 2205SS24-7]|uniref:hypothetical protein n=1 Tax=Ruegeria discodermiae TaxID=3064389 RepID=UPI00274290A9|nr:hypothetical protein [Ruegeria sp. 2205SS24-7]MDP5217355.1 hypothetical protein [Ruegeria sp. 2205SS24-7]
MSIFILAFAVTILNTMPIWLAELAFKSGGSEVAVGLLASAVLVSAALGCLFGSSAMRPLLLRSAGGVVCGGLAGAAIAQTIAPPVLFAGACVVGLLQGIVLALSLSRKHSEAAMLRMIGNGIAIGCVTSFVLLAGTFAAGLPILPLLAALAGAQALLLQQQPPPLPGNGNTQRLDWARDLILLPFFICMGAYWTFLEIFAAEQELGGLSGWLAASLLLSAIGSFLAGATPDRITSHARIAGLLLAGFAGCLTYLSQTEMLLGASILINAFGLFLFFPLYLDRTDAPAAGMARYLLGFALGGGAGSLAIALGGYPALGVTVAASGLIALPALRRSRPKPDVPRS